MDEFEEYRARSYSMNSAEALKMDSAMKCQKYLNLSEGKSQNTVNDIEGYSLDGVCSDEDNIDIDLYFRPRISSADSDVSQVFAEMDLRGKNTRGYTKMCGDEKSPAEIGLSRTELLQRNRAHEKGTRGKAEKCKHSSNSFLISNHRQSSISPCSDFSFNYNCETELQTKDLDLSFSQARMRTHSMPTQNKYSRYRKKLIAKHQNGTSTPDSGFSSRQESQSDDFDVDDCIRVRTFSTSSKGVINRGDSFVRRHSNPTLPNMMHRGSLYEFRGRSYSVTSSSEKSSCSSTFSSPRYHRVVVLGDHDVGKTSIINQFMTSECVANSAVACDDTSSHCVSVMLDEEEAILDFIDHTVSEEDADVYPSGDAYMVVFSVVDQESFDRAIEVIYELRKQQILYNTPVILVGNKQDVVKQRTVNNEIGIKMALHYDVKYTEISTILNHKVDDLLAGTLKQIRLREKRKKKMLRKGFAVSNDSDTRSTDGTTHHGRCLKRKIFKGAMGKMLRQHPLFRSCDNLLVL